MSFRDHIGSLLLRIDVRVCQDNMGWCHRGIACMHISISYRLCYYVVCLFILQVAIRRVREGARARRENLKTRPSLHSLRDMQKQDLFLQFQA